MDGEKRVRPLAAVPPAAKRQKTSEPAEEQAGEPAATRPAPAILIISDGEDDAGGDIQIVGSKPVNGKSAAKPATKAMTKQEAGPSRSRARPGAKIASARPAQPSSSRRPPAISPLSQAKARNSGDTQAGHEDGNGGDCEPPPIDPNGDLLLVATAGPRTSRSFRVDSRALARASPFWDALIAASRKEQAAQRPGSLHTPNAPMSPCTAHLVRANQELMASGVEPLHPAACGPDAGAPGVPTSPLLPPVPVRSVAPATSVGTPISNPYMGHVDQDLDGEEVPQPPRVPNSGLGGRNVSQPPYPPPPLPSVANMKGCVDLSGPVDQFAVQPPQPFRHSNAIASGLLSSPLPPGTLQQSKPAAPPSLWAVYLDLSHDIMHAHQLSTLLHAAHGRLDQLPARLLPTELCAVLLLARRCGMESIMRGHIEAWLAGMDAAAPAAAPSDAGVPPGWFTRLRIFWEVGNETAFQAALGVLVWNTQVMGGTEGELASVATGPGGSTARPIAHEHIVVGVGSQDDRGGAVPDFVETVRAHRLRTVEAILGPVRNMALLRGLARGNCRVHNARDHAPSDCDAFFFGLVVQEFSRRGIHALDLPAAAVVRKSPHALCVIFEDVHDAVDARLQQAQQGTAATAGGDAAQSTVFLAGHEH